MIAYILGGILAAALLFFAGLMLLTVPGKGADFTPFLGWRYAHRGLFTPGTDAPENSRKAFRLAAEAGYGMEFDVHLSADGKLFVMHDEELSRTAEGTGRIVDKTAAELSPVTLRGTAETVPTFEEVLAIVGGRVPLIIELKSVDGNAPALVDAVMAVLKDYDGVYCLESFDPQAVREMRRYPAAIRGQLSTHPHRKGQAIPDRFFCNLGFNLFTRPHFVAYDVTQVKSHLGVILCRKLWRVQTILWTIRTPEQMDFCLKEGCLPIFEKTALSEGGDSRAD